ncbi:Transposase [Bacillus cereus ATCC 14579]|uniref:Transposase n=1 Tax=Bacillus cereus (strain ATCC 14579 / DSM 31 / CCUG 7414 / JCM 2152 / NBRC 15305 / NCIMB 9373 / NCTC 2599 / NRRL B-3711) TaxID=226900 RepID=Q815P7_BACCR|nr:Transposase [Bacillus cereus ATCC 14579]ETT80160.1 transposase [Bacillus cereus]
MESLWFHVRDIIIIFSFPRKESERENQDEIGKGFILEVSQFKNRRKGVRQITLKLAGQFQGVYNLKRIPRIMKKH